MLYPYSCSDMVAWDNVGARSLPWLLGEPDKDEPFFSTGWRREAATSARSEACRGKGSGFNLDRYKFPVRVGGEHVSPFDSISCQCRSPAKPGQD